MGRTDLAQTVYPVHSTGTVHPGFELIVPDSTDQHKRNRRLREDSNEFSGGFGL